MDDEYDCEVCHDTLTIRDETGMEHKCPWCRDKLSEYQTDSEGE